MRWLILGNKDHVPYKCLFLPLTGWDQCLTTWWRDKSFSRHNGCSWLRKIAVISQRRDEFDTEAIDWSKKQSANLFFPPLWGSQRWIWWHFSQRGNWNPEELRAGEDKNSFMDRLCLKSIVTESFTMGLSCCVRTCCVTMTGGHVGQMQVTHQTSTVGLQTNRSRERYDLQKPKVNQCALQRWWQLAYYSMQQLKKKWLIFWGARIFDGNLAFCTDRNYRFIIFGAMTLHHSKF